jgi:hypothetical protein
MSTGSENSPLGATDVDDGSSPVNNGEFFDSQSAVAAQLQDISLSSPPISANLPGQSTLPIGNPPNRPSGNAHSGDPVRGSPNLTDPYFEELTLNIEYFQAQVNMFKSVLDIYIKYGHKSVAESHRKELCKNLPPKPKIKKPTAGEKKNDLLQMIIHLRGAPLLEKLKELLVDSKSCTTIPHFDAKETDIGTIKNIIIEGQKIIDVKQKALLDCFMGNSTHLK